MRQIKLERAENFFHYFACTTIKEFTYDGKRGYALPKYAIRFIDMYSISFLGNSLLNKLMLDVVFRVYESIFILFSVYFMMLWTVSFSYFFKELKLNTAHVDLG